MKTFLAPLAVVVALTFSSSAFAWVTRPERAVIRNDVRELRYDVRHAGPVVTPAERANFYHDVRDLRGDVRRAVRW